MMTPESQTLLDAAAGGGGLVIVLTGAGISAESGIPTFRGPAGYWTVGSKVYYPQELATRVAFERMPEEVWRWYLYRLGVCWRAEPNAAHQAVAELEAELGDRFLLITQNVDGLHLRAGNSHARTFEIHGSINFMRCARGCNAALYPVPEPLRTWWGQLDRAPDRNPDHAAPELDDDDRAHLHCRGCGGWMRPHVLWFDEYYDEKHYRYESSIAAADQADLLIIVGTSGATNLPNQIAAIAARRGSGILLIDPEASPFSELAQRGSRVGPLPADAREAGRATRYYGSWIRGPAGRWLPPIVERLATYSRARPGS